MSFLMFYLLISLVAYVAMYKNQKNILIDFECETIPFLALIWPLTVVIVALAAFCYGMITLNRKFQKFLDGVSFTSKDKK